MKPKPLAGRTVVLTRPPRQAAGVARALRRLGARVVLAPAIRIAPPSSWAALDRALRDLRRFDAVVFASANAVEAFFARARRVLGRRPAPPARVHAIGPATARALREGGWTRVRISPLHQGSALARSLGRVRGLRVLIPRARVARPELPELLRRAGARVTAVEAYRTLPDPAGLSSLRGLVRRGGDPWVAFASGSAVERFVAAVGRGNARRFFARARAASIGPVTSASLNRFGIKPAAEAPRSTPDALAEAILERCAPAPLASLEKSLVLALREAGEVLRRRFGKVRIRYKGPANIVTQADHASEARILRILRGRFPGHDFLGEESGARLSGSDYLWIIDPLDGTTNYAHGFPMACVSIGLLHRGRPLLGGVYDPFRKELFLARRGGGTTLNGRPISVSRTGRLSEALLLTGFPYDRAKRSRYYLDFYRAFMERCHDVRRSGSAALDLAWTAAGRVEGFWEFKLSPWDVAAGWLLVTEAGGQVTDFSGRSWQDPFTLGRQTLATNRRLHSPMLRLLKKR